MSLKPASTALAISLLTVGSANGYEGLQKDYAACSSGQGKIENEKVVEACSRLIKNAKKENSTIGMFYALRASANSDRALNCRDAKKARKLIEDPGLADALDALEKSNC